MDADARPRRLGRAGFWRLARWAAIPLLLLVPLTAMQFTDEVQWTAGDFVFAAVLLGGGLGLFELATWKIRAPLARLAVGAVAAAIVAVIWVDAAVGLF